MRKINFFLIFAIVLICFALFGCARKNPLLKLKRKDASIFLVDASLYAANKLHIFGIGGTYGDCMYEAENNNYKKYSKSTCNKIYKGMLVYAKSKDFNDLTLKDLKDQRAFKKLSKAYASIILANLKKYIMQTVPNHSVM